MADTNSNASLNQALITLNRSLVQYVGECWPWTAADADSERESVTQLVERQQQQTARIADLLSSRGWSIDFGMFSTDFTDLHYVALDFLLDQLITNQEAVVASIESAKNDCSDDSSATSLLDEIVTGERQNLATLEELAKARSARSAA